MNDQIKQRAQELHNKVRAAYKKWCEYYAIEDDGLPWLTSPTTMSEISLFESKFGVILPEELKAALSLGIPTDVDLYLADGRAGFSGRSSILDWGNDEAIGLAKEVAESLSDCLPKTTGAVKSSWYHPKWIEIGHGGSISWCLDFAPEEGGHIGQIIMILSDYETPEVRVVADNFFDFLEIMIDSLEGEASGKYVSDW